MSSFEPHIPNSIPSSASIAWQRWVRFGAALVRQFAHLLGVLALSLLAAIPAALVGGFFRVSVLWANQVRAAHPALIYALPVCGLVIALLYRVCRIGHRGEILTITRAIQSAERGDAQRQQVSVFLAPVVYAASVLSHLFGASAGCEGASILLGGGVGAQIARWFQLTGRDFGTLVFCSMASAFSPLLGTPLAASVFVLERCNSRRVQFLLPCLAASFLSWNLTSWLGLAPMRFELESVPSFSFLVMGQVLLLAAACTAAGFAFRWSLREVEALTDRFLPNRFLAMSLGGTLLLLLTLSLGTQDFCGTGLPVIAAALKGTAGNWAFFWKILLTALALGVGFKGGQIVPAFFVGTVLGCVLAPTLGLDPSFAAALGLVALFTAVVRCPIAAAFLGFEIFFGAGFGWFLLTAGLCMIPTWSFFLVRARKA